MGGDLKSLILISERPEDRKFFRSVSILVPCLFTTAASASEFMTTLLAHPDCVVLWDADHPEIHNPSHPLSFKAMRDAIAGLVPASRVFAITDKNIGGNSDVFFAGGLDKHILQNNLIRKFGDSSAG